MSILSDVQIERLCVAPTEVYDSRLEARLGPDVMTLEHYADPAVAARKAQERSDARRAKCIRPLTDEELAAFVPMIAPFHPNQIREIETREMRGGELCVDTRKIVSHGLTSYGYDVVLADSGIKIFTNLNNALIDPKRMDDRCLADGAVQTDTDGAKFFILPPNSYALGHTVEYFRIPRDIMVVCLGKSTYARAGAIVNTTPIEPGFEGVVVIEISNSTSLPLKVYLNEGIAQFLFFQGTEQCRVSYADRKGKYQGQTTTVLSKV